jgi:hypothetical protein
MIAFTASCITFRALPFPDIPAYSCFKYGDRVARVSTTYIR